MYGMIIFFFIFFRLKKLLFGVRVQLAWYGMAFVGGVEWERTFDRVGWQIGKKERKYLDSQNVYLENRKGVYMPTATGVGREWRNVQGDVVS